MSGRELKAHGGFVKRYDILKESINQAIESFSLEKQISGIRFVGHSLGGALATLAAADYKTSHQKTKIKLDTVGSPRVFDIESAKEVEKLLGSNNVRRLFVEGDLIPAVGKGIIRLLGNGAHVGTPYALQKESLNPLANHSARTYEKIIELAPDLVVGARPFIEKTTQFQIDEKDDDQSTECSENDSSDEFEISEVEEEVSKIIPENKNSGFFTKTCNWIKSFF